MSQEWKVIYKQYLAALKAAYINHYIALLAAGKIYIYIFFFHKMLYVKFIIKGFYKDGRIRDLMWKQVIHYFITY